MKKTEECYLKNLYAQAGLEKDKEQGMADREVTCAEISTRGRSQWQSGGEKQRTWTSQESQENRNKPGYSRLYDRWDRGNTGKNRDTEVKKTDKKQSKFSENSQHS